MHLRRGQEPGEETLKYQTDIHAGSLCEGLRVRTLHSGTCSLTWRGSSRKIRYSPHEEWDLVARVVYEGTCDVMLFMDVTCTSSKYETRSGGLSVDEFADAEPGACLLNGEHGRMLCTVCR